MGGAVLSHLACAATHVSLSQGGFLRPHGLTDGIATAAAGPVKRKNRLLPIFTSLQTGSLPFSRLTGALRPGWWRLSSRARQAAMGAAGNQREGDLSHVRHQ